ncbi:hypothetical protein GCM10011369_07310 [Neiella marina]|uniref:non-specific serine/threonine protein kinase n=1 Tax=Neiella marina TaxID=508461 RepID=A0A8J2U2S9_9GAMM|nr:RIO1 family regulatory kinase/ATPase [Neiella marina]GGA68190.1 hypothetical protein GCM10011369_07310 [Neiella marina]
MKYFDIQQFSYRRLIQAADGPLQADVYEVQRDNNKYILKDYSARPKLFRRTICRWQLRREWLALLKLRHVKHVPKPIAFGGNKLLMSKLAQCKASINQDNSDSLETKVAQIHQAGVCHNDLHSKNLMLNQTQAFIFDFGAATFSPKDNNSLSDKVKGQLFKLCQLIDRMAVVKYKWKRDRKLLRPDEAHLVSLVEKTRWLSRCWRRFKQWHKQKSHSPNNETVNSP